jgi:hypothetical protein
MTIAVVVPTIREEKLKEFLNAWDPLFKKHRVNLYVVKDGENPTCNGQTINEIMGEYSDLIYNFNDGVRNLGFAKAYKDGAEIIISLDDDVLPEGDTIQDHLDILNTKQPLSYINSVDDIYMRGFPYWAREEAEVVFSHGLWRGVYDFDASTQLVLGTPQPNHRKMPIPKGVLMPVCVMNVAIKRKVLPYYYQAPMYGDINRFADIWSGWGVKKAIDNNNWSMVNGYAKVNHNRASNPFVNLVKEAKGVGINEDFENSEYYKLYQEKLNRWQKFLGE